MLFFEISSTISKFRSLVNIDYLNQVNNIQIITIFFYPREIQVTFIFVTERNIHVLKILKKSLFFPNFFEIIFMLQINLLSRIY